jgi:hypothetical protein
LRRLNTALTWAIVSKYITTVFWPKNQDAWTESSRIKYRMSFITTTSVGIMAAPSVDYGNVTFTT